MLSDYLEVSGSPDETTSHSLKATTLVWAARFGIDDNHRTILGHHSLKGNSMACYSRDVLSLPLRHLCTMLDSIKRGLYRPDQTRSGWMRGDHLGASGETVPLEPEVGTGEPEAGIPDVDVGSPSVKEEDVSVLEGFDPNNPFKERPLQEGELQENVQEIVSDEDFEGSASSDGGGIEEIEVSEELFFEKQRSMLDVAAEKAVPGDLLQNRRSKMLHKRSKDESNHLQPLTACGLHGSSYDHFPEGCNFAWPKCSKCFKDDVGQDVDHVQILNAGKRRRQQ